MSYYDHATLMHLKQGPWDPDPLHKHRHHVVSHGTQTKSASRMRGTISILVVAASLMVLGASGLGA